MAAGIAPIIQNMSALYQHICNKYPDIKVIPGEDLNLERMQARMVYSCWINTSKFPTVLDIAFFIGVTERQIYRIAKAHKFPKR